MALLFWDSYDHYTTEISKWTTEVIGGFGSIVIGAYGRNGTNGLRIATGTSPTYLRRTLPSTPSTLIMGEACRAAANTPPDSIPVWNWLDGTTIQLQLRLENDGTLSVWRGGTAEIASSSPGAVPYRNVYYYIEMKALIDNAAGTVEVRVNDIVVIDANGLDTQESGTAQITQIENGGGSSDGTIDYDDLYVCDDSGAQCNDFLSDIGLYLLMPEGAGAHADWTPLVGVNWQEVDDNPPDDDTTYNLSATATDRDSFEMEDLPGTLTGTIHAVGIAIDCRKDDAGVRTVQPSVRSGGADYDGTSVNIANTYAFHILEAWELDPDTAAGWLVAAVNAMEAGYELVA